MLTPHTQDITANKTPQYIGIVRCTDNGGGFLWQRSISIVRTNKTDALNDAIKEISYIESLGK